MRITCLLLTCFGFAALLGSSDVLNNVAASSFAQKKDIYDEKADAKAVIENAVEQAKKEGKNVLITWGGDWCGWCHILDRMLESDKALNTTLKENYVRVMVDVRSNHELRDEMKVNTLTVPYQTILDANGNKVIDQEMSKMSKAGSYDPALLLAYLNKYKAKPTQLIAIEDPKKIRKNIYDEKADAKAVIAKAVLQAQKEGKSVLITWGANWCGWCHVLDGIVKKDPAIKSYLEKNYVRVTVDIDSNEALMKEMDVSTPTIPHLTILNADGGKITEQAMRPMKKDGSYDSVLLLSFLEKSRKQSASTVQIATSQPSKRKDIYDEKADAKAVIAKAVVQAQKESKHVLITWGGNWCGWCHLLHGTFENNKEINKELKAFFVRVTVDSNTNKELMKEMKVKPTGYPYLTVLDVQGNKVMDQSTGPLEKDGAHEPSRVMAFLKKARPTTTPKPTLSIAKDAESTLSIALSKLSRDDQRLFVKFSTDWCGWCKRIDALLQDKSISPILSKDYAFISIDQEKVPGAIEMRKRLSTNFHGGSIPWYAILDKEGNVLSTATFLSTTTNKSVNTGYPQTPEDIVHFMGMLNKTATTISDTELNTVETELKTLAKKYGY